MSVVMLKIKNLKKAYKKAYDVEPNTLYVTEEDASRVDATDGYALGMHVIWEADETRVERREKFFDKCTS